MMPDIYHRRTPAPQINPQENYQDGQYSYDYDHTIQETVKPFLPYTTRHPMNPNNHPPIQPRKTAVNNEISKEIALNVLALSQELIKQKLESPSTLKTYQVLSPISITSALQLAFLGARGGTYDELKKV